MTVGARPASEGSDNRRGRRTPVDLSASVGGRRRRKARALDLSLVGCLLRTDAALARGAVLDLTLELPDGPLCTKGRVAAASLDGEAPPGPQSFLAGLEFLGLAATDQARLRAFLEAEAKRRRVENAPPA